jgi:peptidyl-prolyl cis-trans isomerase SurA
MTVLHRSSLVGTVTLGLLLAATIGHAQPSESSDNPPRIIERVLVKVNGQIITQTDLETRQISEIRSTGVQPQNNIELVNMIREVTPGVIARAVEELLLVQRGRDLGYRLSDEQFEEIVANLKAENAFETDEEFEQAIREAEGMSMADLRRVMERQMLVSQIQQLEILGRVTITDIEAREYYDTHLEEFTEPGTATLREILIAVPEGVDGVNVAAADEALVVAQTTVARLRGGEDFATLAEEVSDSSSKANGGLVGPLRLSEYSEVIQDLIVPLDVGEVADPVRSPQGYQIVMLEDRTNDLVQPFNEVREEISNNVFNDRRTEEYFDYLESLRAEAVIEWKNEELRQMYEVFIADPANAGSSSLVP